ncbi:hypothetical protein NUW58_g1763 [Xylaria curta]|uniref:Uncharacterized protein n=1 Tax=Xylaria curta TaxID=42375 RepID=A0ACC1PLA1_9PEZI|nr:hypothetical protein NUW58_g1763 [Xylaria curta]
MSDAEGSRNHGLAAMDVNCAEYASQLKREDPTLDIRQPHSELYAEALLRYPSDEHFDKAAETKLQRKLDYRILPLLSICYFFYYVDKTTLSYAAIFGIKTDLALNPTDYSWLSSLFYFGWLPWRYEFLIVGAFCAFWAIVLFFLVPNSPATFHGFNHDEHLMMIARMRQNQTGIEQNRIHWGQVREAFLDYKTWLFFSLGFVGSIPNGGISNFSTLVIQGLGFDTLHTALLGIPQGVLVVIWIGLGALCNEYMPKNCRTLVSAIFMVPTIAGALGFLLAPHDAYVGRLIRFYLTGSYIASFVICLSVVIGNTGGQSKKMIVSGMIWLGACVGNIAGPFFYKTEQAPGYSLGIGYSFMWENKRKEKLREQMRQDGSLQSLNQTAMKDLTDKENPNFEYVY